MAAFIILPARSVSHEGSPPRHSVSDPESAGFINPFFIFFIPHGTEVWVSFAFQNIKLAGQTGVLHEFFFPVFDTARFAIKFSFPNHLDEGDRPRGAISLGLESDIHPNFSSIPSRNAQVP